MSSITFGKVFGIRLELHYSWFFVIALLAYGLAVDFFPMHFGGLSATIYWGLGIVAAILLFVSVLLHELSHSVVAQYNDIPVNKITLFFFGGVANIREKNITPKTEFLMAIAGPLFSVVFGLLFFIIYQFDLHLYITAVTFYLWQINLILAAFNMIPGFPLDGGRVFRAALWYWLDDVQRATKYASGVGKFFAVLLGFVGVLGMISGNFGTVWFVFLAIFLYFIAHVSYQETVLRASLGSVPISKILVKHLPSVEPDTPYEELKETLTKQHLDLIVVEAEGEYTGYITPQQVKAKSGDAKQVAKRITHCPRIPHDASLYQALRLFNDHQVPLLRVYKDKKLQGFVSQGSLEYFIRYELDESPT